MPPLSEQDARAILEKVLKLSKAESCEANISVSTGGNIRFARSTVTTAGSSSDRALVVESNFGKRSGTATINQFDDASIERVVRRSEELARLVESLPVACTHFDAYRFFTPAARPLNRHRPDRSTTALLEQRGCLHANMDLYKWAFKLAPFTPAELIADAFELARDIREVDMRASPYDLSALGFAAIPIETPAGREDYAARQRAFAARGEPLRARLGALCRRLASG